MKLPKKNDDLQINATANSIWEHIVYSMDQYTHDSQFSKFYLPEEIIPHCRESAAIFAQVHYAPIISTEEAYKTRLYSFFLLSMVCGVQIYLKERSVLNNMKTYSVNIDESVISEAKRKVGKQLFDGAVILETIDQVMNLFLTQLIMLKQKRRFSVKDHEFDEEKFDRFLPASILWGYLFAKEIVTD